MLGIFFNKKFITNPVVQRIVGFMKRAADHFDYKKDMKICGCSLVKYVPSKYRESLGATGSQSTCYWALDKMFKGITLSKNDRFVDMGCGKGRVLAYLIREGAPCRLTGVELNTEVAEYAQSWAKKYDQITILNANAFDLDPNDYTFYFLARPFETETFKKYVAFLEEKLTHPIRIIYWVDTQSGYYLEGRKGWKKTRQKWMFFSHGLTMFHSPQRYSVWEYEP